MQLIKCILSTAAILLSLVSTQASFSMYDDLQYTSSEKNNNLDFILPSGGDSLKSVYEWRILDFEYPTYESRLLAIQSGKFIPENNLPLGVDVLGYRLFITMPRWKNGVPASLSWLPLPPKERSPPMQPYPNWEAHGDPDSPDCSKLISVYRTFIDDCGRLWAIDAGVVNATIKINQVCPPKIVVFDLSTDEQILSYELPPDQVKQDSLHSNIIVDVRKGECHDAYAYVTDVWRYGLVVFSLAKGRSWRTTHHLYYPNPLAADFTLHGLNFQWPDGVFGMSLLPLNEYNDRIMFYHPMASFKEIMISTSILRNEELWTSGDTSAAVKTYVIIGDRGPRGQSSTSGIDRNNVMFYTLVQQDAVGCWDTRKPYAKGNLGLVAQNSTTLFFPNDLKIDREHDQGVWVLSNRLPMYLYAKLDHSDVNFRIQRASVKASIDGSICDPSIPASNTVMPDNDDCY